MCDNENIFKINQINEFCNEINQDCYILNDFEEFVYVTHQTTQTDFDLNEQELNKFREENLQVTEIDEIAIERMQLKKCCLLTSKFRKIKKQSDINLREKKDQQTKFDNEINKVTNLKENETKNNIIITRSKKIQYYDIATEKLINSEDALKRIETNERRIICSKKHKILEEFDKSERNHEEKRNEYIKTRAAKNKIRINANDDILGETFNIELTASATQPRNFKITRSRNLEIKNVIHKKIL
jgi:hypothetical protein